MQAKCAIGVFDSGYGGLTVFRAIREALPQYDYLYLGDNARAPYGNRSFDTVYHYTRECVQWFFSQGCRLVILACNTASAKALRSIQQIDLPVIAPNHRVLGVIRPTAEVIGRFSLTGHVGVLGTSGTISSGSYEIEINKFSPQLKVHSLACPIWVPLVEYGEHTSPGADYFVQKYLDELLDRAPAIDTILLACTHYPLLMEKIRKYLPENINVVAQGNIIANSLTDYLLRHPEMESNLSRDGQTAFYTTDDPAGFDASASVFLGAQVRSAAAHIPLV